ncbi:hypothetical protein GCM10011369_12440 [Neiella marina]|uniref:Uncharacterized protein n=1 Tax=Neiella marina TaxID=508461 RepID=A0A8J2U406_9GAMM|nr:patatin-like phospholipase family protein [Neiella marina]GGA72193.1 hypothetical protein GCM10011369_12440 [Neiella marina]
MSQYNQSNSPAVLLAGRDAYNHIRQNGLQPQHINAMLGASGGPKWFLLAALDQYLAGDYFANRQQPLDLLGTSAGGWRFACYCQKQPAAATKRFVQHYSQTVYSAQADADEITDKAIALVDELLGDHGVEQIINHPSFRLHLVVCRGRHLAASNNKYRQTAALAVAASLNALSRDFLGSCFERIVLHNSDLSAAAPSPFLQLNDLPTRNYKLTTENLRAGLLATGAIPLVIHPQQYLTGPGKGYYYDGGIVDYHFDLPLKTKGLVLYPHFYPAITPGWFDKALKWRSAAAENYRRVLMIAPSSQLIASLPHGKISDRNDFKNLSPDQRIPYWQTVIAEGQRLAEFFAERHVKQDWMEYVQLMETPPR